jgi:hypothetical protein
VLFSFILKYFMNVRNWKLTYLLTYLMFRCIQCILHVLSVLARWLVGCGQRRAFPKALRLKWLQKMRHSKVKLSLASSVGRVDLGRILGRTASTANGGNSSGNSGSISSSGGGRSKPAIAVRPFPTVRGQSSNSKRRDGGGDEEQEDGKDDVTMYTAPDTDVHGGTVVGGFVEICCPIL